MCRLVEWSRLAKLVDYFIGRLLNEDACGTKDQYYQGKELLVPRYDGHAWQIVIEALS